MHKCSQEQESVLVERHANNEQQAWWNEPEPLSHILNCTKQSKEPGSCVRLLISK